MMDFDCGEQCAAGPAGRLVPLESAEGLVLAHDITEIVPGRKKGPAFKKGHVVTKDDLAHLARLGKRHLYVLEMGPEVMHEDEASARIARALCGEGVEPGGPPTEGKITLVAAVDGVFRVRVEGLAAFNTVPEVMCATIHRHTPVRRGQAVAGTRPIPLLIRRENVARAEEAAAAGGGLVSVAPYRLRRAGVVVTGNEVATGLIEDGFAPVVRRKLEELGGEVSGVRYAPDDRAAVAAAIGELADAGAELIITTAGMSVDPDDVTRFAIADAGGEELVYGSPVLPGAMFLVGELARAGRRLPVLGAPACALFHPTTALDLVLPRVMAGERFDRAKIAALGHGGYCQNCPEGCHYPRCGFGRGA
jgi:hypothetical protein